MNTIQDLESKLLLHELHEILLQLIHIKMYQNNNILFDQNLRVHN